MQGGLCQATSVCVGCLHQGECWGNSTEMGTDGPSALSSDWSTGWCEVGWNRCSVGVLSGKVRMYLCERQLSSVERWSSMGG